MNPAFVAGATGYTGREVVRLLAERGCPVVAHVRPDSPRLAEWSEKWTALGASVDTTPWQAAAMEQRLSQLRPALLFALLGTTKARARRASSESGVSGGYDSVDYGLSALLLGAAQACAPPPKFVYLSAAGVQEGSRGGYMGARARMERELEASGLPYVIARPSFITGPDRDESRPGERAGAWLADHALAALGALGAKRLRERYRSTSNTVLAEALVRAALDPALESVVLESEALR